MAGERLPMRRIRDVLRLKASGMSKRQIAASVGIGPTAAGDFFAPHDLCVDARGDLYVAEVVMSAGGHRGAVSPQCHALQKFTRPASAP